MQRIPIRSWAEYEKLDEKEVIRGRMAGWLGREEPDETHSFAFWHGWREGVFLSGRVKRDEAQAQLEWDILRCEARKA